MRPTADSVKLDIYMTLVTKKALHTCNRLYLRTTCFRISSLLTCFCDVESQRVQDQFPDKRSSNMNVLESKQLQLNHLFPCNYRHKNSEFFLKGDSTCIPASQFLAIFFHLHHRQQPAQPPTYQKMCETLIN